MALSGEKETQDYDSVDLEYKIKIAVDRIVTHRDRYNPSTYFAFGGGKDSVLVKSLIQRAGIPCEPHYHRTTVDPPELMQFIREHHPDVIWDRPIRTMCHRGGEPQTIKSMFDLIVFKGTPPTRKFRYCCEVFKEYGGRGRVVIDGVRWAESPKRSERSMYERCSQYADTWYLHPIIDWSDFEVWAYIHQNKIPYCSLYDEGFKRLGCIMCPKASINHRMIEIKRWPKFYRAYLRCFERMLAVKPKTHKLQWANAQEVMTWWLEGRHVEDEIEGCEFFG